MEGKREGNEAKRRFHVADAFRVLRIGDPKKERREKGTRREKDDKRS